MVKLTPLSRTRWPQKSSRAGQLNSMVINVLAAYAFYLPNFIGVGWLGLAPILLGS
jgi:hypothetical protein